MAEQVATWLGDGSSVDIGAAEWGGERVAGGQTLVQRQEGQG